MKEHWDQVFEKTAVNKLGWYEENPDPSIHLVKQCKLLSDARILNVGTGASTMVDELLRLGFNNIIASDISPKAIQALKERLGPDLSHRINWLIDDLTNSKKLHLLDQVDLWHDRAVLHFFLNPEEQDAYFRLLKSLVKANGFVIIAAFSMKGARRCSGLKVHRYSQGVLEEKLGEDFQLKRAFEYTFTNPSGDTREYIYTLFQRIYGN